MLTDLGKLPSGGRLKLNKLALETELLVAEGFIEPHFFAVFSDGHGGEAFYRILSDAASSTELLKKISLIPADKTPPDQWQYQFFARILKKYHVIMVTKDCDHQMIRNMGMTAASTLNEALALAFEITGNDASVSVIPDGVSVIINNA